MWDIYIQQVTIRVTNHPFLPSIIHPPILCTFYKGVRQPEHSAYVPGAYDVAHSCCEWLANTWISPSSPVPSVLPSSTLC